VNYVPGTHNFEKENREAFYSMLGDHFYAGDATFNPAEIPSEAEVKTLEQLRVELPTNNATFSSLALALSKSLPRPRRNPGREIGIQQMATHPAQETPRHRPRNELHGASDAGGQRRKGRSES
jgi:hypothetical protein